MSKWCKHDGEQVRAHPLDPGTLLVRAELTRRSMLGRTRCLDGDRKRHPVDARTLPDEIRRSAATGLIPDLDSRAA